MKVVTKYVSNDGVEHLDEARCREHELTNARIETVAGLLLNASEGCDFANGSGYIQHDPEGVDMVRRGLCEIANQISPHKWFLQTIEDVTVDASWAGRLIDEMRYPLLRKAWYRISCIDKQFREWGQPYFVHNPDAATGERLNP